MSETYDHEVYIRRLEQENAQLKSDYLDLTEKHKIEINGWAESLQQREQVVETLKTDLAQCKADKAEMVRRNNILRDRPDLPTKDGSAYEYRR